MSNSSVALRKLVEEARKTTSEKDKIRLSKEAAYRFMSAKCGDSRGFEEACRALFKGDSESFSKHTQSWPADVRNLAHKIASGALS